MNFSKAGAFGQAAIFAFYPNKQITTGEGGALVTSDERIALQAERLRNQGRDPAAGKSWEAWVKKYNERKAAGESNIALHPERLD